MSYETSSPAHSRVINAFFDTQAAANTAVEQLTAAGIPSQHITQSGGQNSSGETASGGYEEKGFWEGLKDLFIPDEDRHTYAEGLRRGGYLVSVRTDEANYNRVLDILDNEGSVDLDEREGQWRSEGWSGYTGAGLAATAASGLSTAAIAPAGADGKSSSTTTTDRYAETAPSTARASAPAPLGGKDDTLQLYQENLRVGKRDVDHGRVRLRSYVVETPVTDQINLREDKVTVDRKPVDRIVGAGDAIFQDRTIEAEERAEEAVVSKEARVTEEISLRKSSEDRVQTVSDSVRHTEVDLQDERGTAPGIGSKFSSTTDASRIVEHMDVISADGQKIGTVDHLDGPDTIKLAKNTSPDGQHHLVPFAWIDHVDQHVHLKKSLAEIKAGY